MERTRCWQRRGKFTGWPTMLAFLVVAAMAPSVRAQGEVLGPPLPAVADGQGSFTPSLSPADGSPADGDVMQTGCSTCGNGLLGGPGLDPAPAVGCPTGSCYPGRYPCDCCCDADGKAGRLLCGIYQCICCPDPCYEPRWVALANSAFFADSPRPVTQLRIRGDFAWDVALPDRAEWIWARVNRKGPRFPGGGANPPGEPNLRHLNEGTLYFEGAVERFSFFVELPYRYVEPTLYTSASGFADMNVGTKSVLLDCDLILATFQFRTLIPTGNFTRGLGTGHVSLEPSLLFALKLTPRDYLQAQFAYLFPIGGDSEFQGPIFHWHLSYNRLLWACGKDIELIGTLELNRYAIRGGAFTDPLTGLPLRARDVGDIFNLGPGIRLNVCNKIDVGVGSAFAISDDRLADQLLRFEFRWRF